jgi:hypothetical protein
LVASNTNVQSQFGESASQGKATMDPTVNLIKASFMVLDHTFFSSKTNMMMTQPKITGPKPMQKQLNSTRKH